MCWLFSAIQTLKRKTKEARSGVVRAEQQGIKQWIRIIQCLEIRGGVKWGKARGERILAAGNTFCFFACQTHSTTPRGWRGRVVKAGSLIMFCTRHTCFVDYRAQKCFVAFTHTDCMQITRACGRARGRGCLLNGRTVYISLNSNRQNLPLTRANGESWDWWGADLPCYQLHRSGAQYSGSVSCCFLFWTAWIHYSAKVPTCPCWEDHYKWAKTTFIPQKKKENCLCMTPVMAKINCIITCIITKGYIMVIKLPWAVLVMSFWLTIHVGIIQ